METTQYCYRIAMDAFYRFNADDGWAIASHIALSALMAMFPFVIVLTAIASFFGTKELADEVADDLIDRVVRALGHLSGDERTSQAGVSAIDAESGGPARPRGTLGRSSLPLAYLARRATR